MTQLTVVIPTFNRAEDLSRCLEALALQSEAVDSFEVVVVDDGSTDTTPELLGNYRAPLRLRVIRQQRNSGQAAALNRGIEAAHGAYCLFLDDDIVADEGLVGEHLRRQRETGGVLAVGALRLRLVGKPGGLARHFADWWEAHYRRLDEGVRQPDFWACYSGNLSAPTSALREVGGFDPQLRRSFDVELAYRLVRSGLRIVYLPAASAEQRYAKGFRGIVRDFDGAGAAAVSLLRRHAELIQHPPLGDFTQGGGPGLLARRVLLALHAPVWPLGLLDPFLQGRPSPRLYRWLQLYCFWRSLRSALDGDTWARLTRGTVILMYHAIARPGERASRFVLPPGRLRRQLAWLRFRRYPVLSLDEYLHHRQQHSLPPAKSVVLTFDDGYLDNADLGLPVLLRHNTTATLFAVTGALGDSNRWVREGPVGGRALLSWERARELVDAGLTIGAHTVSHPRLTDLEADQAAEELGGSRAQLEQELGVRIIHLAYPYGKSSAAIQEAAGQAGYETASGIEPGTNGPAVPLLNLRRYEVFGTSSLLRFAIDLWLGRPLTERRWR